MASRLIKKQIGGITFLGFSMAGEESVVIAPEFNLAFDFGRAPRELIPIDHVCLTHGHMDHAAGIAYYFSQRHFVGAPPGTAILHADLVPSVKRLLSAWEEIERHPSPANLVGLRHDEHHEIRRDLIVRAFDVAHPGPSLGFAAIEVRRKLRPEYVGLSGPELVALKQHGVEIQYRLEVPQITYCGDTAAGPFLDRDDVKNAKVLVLECTFLDDEHVHRARAGRHFHVTDLPDALRRLNCEHIVLSHLTRRTAFAEVKRTLANVLAPSALERITILMERPPRRVRP
jgi:ribonuclease Z